jgi:hypothetical protein
LIAARIRETEPNGTPSVAALQQTTRTVPVVFVNVADPVGAGFVDSLARPGGNVTGFLLFEYSMSGKWLELAGPTAVTCESSIAGPLVMPTMLADMRQNWWHSGPKSSWPQLPQCSLERRAAGL